MMTMLEEQAAAAFAEAMAASTAYNTGVWQRKKYADQTREEKAAEKDAERACNEAWHRHALLEYDAALVALQYAKDRLSMAKSRRKHAQARYEESEA